MIGAFAVFRKIQRLSEGVSQPVLGREFNALDLDAQLARIFADDLLAPGLGRALADCGFSTWNSSRQVFFPAIKRAGMMTLQIPMS